MRIVEMKEYDATSIKILEDLELAEKLSAIYLRSIKACREAGIEVTYFIDRYFSI